MLLAYLINAVSFESFHHVVHDHDHTVSHTFEDETDACHRAIYHGDLELGCEHKNHVHKSDIDCQLCDFINNRLDHGFIQDQTSLAFSVSSVDCGSVLQSHTFSQEYVHGQRGPPQV